MKLAVSFPFGVLGEIGQNEFYKQMHNGITEIIKESDVIGIQVYPSQWPCKVLITLKDPTSKEALLVAGINVLGKQIELKDESFQTIRITVKDALLEWDNDKIREILSPYGEIKKVENEVIYIDGEATSWLTGTRFVYMTKVDRIIPNRLTTTDGDKEVTISVWYRRPTENKDKCYKCGGQHDPMKCTFAKKVCFKCQGDHVFRDCPNNDGSRASENVFCFMTEKSPLSNFNMKYPIQVQGVPYSCNEQFIQSQKADLFDDKQAKARIMASENPREMKQIGRKIRGYVDSVWKSHTEQIVMECVRRKVYDHQEVQDYLLSTGDRLIGEGTTDPHFGVGLHISDIRVLSYNEWQGNNLMGKALMEVRSEIKLLQGVRDDSQLLPGASQNTLTSTPGNFNDKPDHNHEPMAVSPTNQAISHKNCAVLFGDSIAKGLHMDNPDYEITPICRAGATIQDISDLMDECSKSPEDVNAVLIQLGTCNWSADATDHVDSNDSLYRDFVEALNSASSKYPRAELLVSSVPPRVIKTPNEMHISAINAEVTALNRSLRDLADKEENVVFVDNDNYLMKNGAPDDSLYVDSDRTGVHLNKQGLALVSSNITKGLSDMFFNSSDEAQWQTKV